MTVTPLGSRDHRTPAPTSPRGRRPVSRRRRITSTGVATQPAALTITFEITLAGESRYADALEILDTLRAATDRLGATALDVAPTLPSPSLWALPERPSTVDGEDRPEWTSLATLDMVATDGIDAEDGAEDADEFDDPHPYDQQAYGPQAYGPHPYDQHPYGGDDRQDGTIQVLPDSRSVVVAGGKVDLTRVEFDLLTFLAEHPRRVFGRSQLLKSVWGYEHTGERTVDVHIRRLRAKLGDSLITTVRSVGYRLADDASVRVLRLH